MMQAKLGSEENEGLGRGGSVNRAGPRAKYTRELRTFSHSATEAASGMSLWNTGQRPCTEAGRRSSGVL